MPRATTRISYLWAEPDPDLVAQQLIEVADELEDLAEPMTIAGEMTRIDIQNRFKSGIDPSGRPWDEWAESYEPWALVHSTGPIFGDRANLHLTGDLKRGLDDRSIFIGTNAGLFVDVSGLPEYWAWNNFGAPDRKTASRGTDVFGDIGGGNNPLPERPFMGISTVARAKIDQMFVLWFEESVQLGTSPLGKKFARHSKRGPSGRSAPR